ncbi:MAG: PadR family transcriptional regulator [Candidatus Bathyarchaeota archaeon]|nr:MAG: PadR family transcriptional regulator [Candidatus Bathyarchaeota archaeon]
MNDHIMKRAAGAPRGLLRFLVLKLLTEKPMSGAKIAEDIEKETKGRWKPGPGSIYPLLAWLLKKGYTKELPREEAGVKNYVLTEKGEDFFKEQLELGQEFLRKLEYLAPMLIGVSYSGPNQEKLRQIREPARRFIMALHDLRIVARDRLTQQNVAEIIKILEDGSDRLEKIIRKIKKK